MEIIKIDSIRYGWLEMRIGNQYMECSDYLDYDTPKQLLRAVLNLLSKKSCMEWVCWQNEPGAAIMQLAMEDNMLNINVYDSAKESYELDTEPDALKASCENCYYSIDIKIMEAVDDLVTAFSLYENGNGLHLYEKHWMDFPRPEYMELKEYAYKLEKQSGDQEIMFCTTY